MVLFGSVTLDASAVGGIELTTDSSGDTCEKINDHSRWFILDRKPYIYYILR